jgi:hypothetical protein
MKIGIVAAVAALAFGATVMVPGQAQANHFHGGWGPVGAGFAVGAIIGATIADGPYYPNCHWVRQYDQWGNYVGNAKVCN